jgi:hypothetical protein
MYSAPLLSLICFLFTSSLSLLLALSLPDAMSFSLATKLRLPSRLSPIGCIRLNCSLSAVTKTIERQTNFPLSEEERLE